MSTAVLTPDRQAEKQQTLSLIGAVAIGRNEGERLRQCLTSLVDQLGTFVYVDSGSTDGSCELAQSLGAHVVNLDMSTPFTAARARNAGIEALRRIDSAVEFVQVVDGDCSIADGWLEEARRTITADPDMAIVCGRRRERFPEASKYNQLCDLEWDGPAGDVKACGGDALIRLSALEEVDGYDGSLIAGEEPEMCVRLRRAGWRIVRIDHDMTWHHAAMSQFGQWWKRAVRAGHAYAEGYARHGRTDDRFRRKEVRSIAFWAGAFPLLMLALAVPTSGVSVLAAITAYARLWHRIRVGREATGDNRRTANLYSTWCVLGKFAQLNGILTYWCRRVFRRESKLIEYK